MLLLPALGGCVANSSNPSVVIRSASSDGERASFDLDLANPGGRNLRVTRLDYEVSHGETAFPVARDTWSGAVELPARGHATLNITTRFSTPPMEPDSNLLHLNGELFFVDKTGFLGLKFMDLTRTPFHAQIEASGSTP